MNNDGCVKGLCLGVGDARYGLGNTGRTLLALDLDGIHWYVIHECRRLAYASSGGEQLLGVAADARQPAERGAECRSSTLFEP